MVSISILTMTIRIYANPGLQTAVNLKNLKENPVCAIYRILFFKYHLCKIHEILEKRNSEVVLER